jgi:phosphatidylglycerol:prolipoprotein diacylglycerol transferase
MMPLAIPFPAFDPVAIQIGPIAIKWYGLAYLAGLLLGWLYIKRLVADSRLWAGGQAPLDAARVDDLLLYMTIGVVAGGRLGFVLLYEPGYYLAHPLEVLQVWRGGMAFHGALLGCAIAVWLFARRQRVSALSCMDLCAAAVPVGLLFGRIANFINGELFGRVTSVPWGMVFPEAKLFHPTIEPAARHPSQLYEAALEGLVLFLILRWLTHRKGALARPGVVIGAFLVGYGAFRAFCEIFREPHAGHALNIGPFTAGQLYSFVMIALGLLFLARARSAATAA